MQKILVCIAISFALAQTAEATGTYYVNSTSGDDTNNCTSASSPCLTVAGAKTLITALADPSHTTIKLQGTFTEAISFGSSDVTKPDTLDGLRITAIDTGNQPTIDTSVAATTAVSVSNVNDVTIDHLTITGGTKAIYVIGSGTTFVNNIEIHDNDISGISSTSTSSAIELLYTKSSTIYDNTIHDVAVTVSDVSYTYLYGIYVYYGYDVAIRNNTISTFGLNSTLAATTSHIGYVYVMFVNGVTGGIVKNNTLTDLSVTETATLADTNQSTSVFGFYGVNLYDTAVTNNSFTNIVSTISADVDGNVGYSGAYGIFIADLRPDTGVALIEHNTVDTVTATQTSDSGAPTAQGISLQYGYGATVAENTIKHITTSHTSTGDDASTNGSATGISGPYFGVATTISKNVIDAVSSTAIYSGTSAGSNVSVRGIYQYIGTGTIVGNTISNVSWSIDNNDAGEYYDYASLYGIDSNFSDGSEIKKNTIQNVSYNYASAGVDGTALLYTYGLAAQNADSITLQKNVIRDIDAVATVTDPTDVSYLAVNSYGIFLNKLPNAVVHNNKIQRLTLTGDAGNSNDMYNYGYGVSTSYVSGTFSKNRIVNVDMTSRVVDGGIGHLFYGISLVTQSELTALTGTIMRDVSSTTTGADSNPTIAGLFVTHGTNLVIEGNQIRPFTVTTDADASPVEYGMYFASDASHVRLLDNSILGNPTSNTPVRVGIYLTGDSTTDADLIHNTIADWEYPVQADGGNKLYLRNNILAAAGADSYALAIGRDTMNNDTFKSDYNLLYNATVAEQLVYDSDNTLAILLADWTNVGGSYGYDVHSINKIPKINAIGRLQKGSKAINAGSKDYPYTKGDTELTYLATDINGHNRPINAKKKKVDIGADEYKK